MAQFHADQSWFGVDNRTVIRPQRHSKYEIEPGRELLAAKSSRDH